MSNKNSKTISGCKHFCIMLMSLNGKAPQLFPFQRGDNSSILFVSIQGKPTFNLMKGGTLTYSCFFHSLDISTQKWVLFLFGGNYEKL